MEIKDKLILFKKQNEIEYKDITDRIISLHKEDRCYRIMFKDGIEIHAKLENVIILTKTAYGNLSDYKVIYQGNVKSDIIKIDLYTNKTLKKYKVYCENGYIFVCNSTDIEFYKFTETDKNLINYWKSCMSESIVETVREMMLRQYNSLNIEPRSVLYSYINRKNFEAKDEDSIICPFDFNNSQLKAIRTALQKKISIIKGPPGTGKTQTILNIICNLIIRGKSIAIVSANNPAIENVEEKLKNSGYDALLASLGNGDRKEEFFNNTADQVKNVKFERVKIPIQKLEFLSKLFESENKSKLLREQIESIKLEQQYYRKFNKDNLIDVSKYKFKDSQALIEYVTKYQEDTKEKNSRSFFG